MPAQNPCHTARLNFPGLSCVEAPLPEMVGITWPFAHGRSPVQKNL
ncbi:hypothetical protein B4096_2263 [Heyndrickxia coagulans]|nr:hypothetical protein B4096_2263 [Heyndrickxia coagulans]